MSLTRILANPEQFDGLEVRVIGYLHVSGGFEDPNVVYVSENDGRNHVVTTASRFLGKSRALPPKDGYVVLNAKYIASNLGFQNGELTSVSELRPWQ